MLNNYREHEYIDVDFERLESFVEDIKSACKSLRGRSLQFPVTYQRGHEIRRTMYDVLSVLNQVPATVRMTQGGLEIVEEKSDYQGPFIQAMTLSYLPAPINYQKGMGNSGMRLTSLPEEHLMLFQRSRKSSCFSAFILYATRPMRIGWLFLRKLFFGITK